MTLLQAHCATAFDGSNRFKKRLSTNRAHMPTVG
jgi:hypothetical protein